jgi:transcriptional regulator with XRE-family HTH domain
LPFTTNCIESKKEDQYKKYLKVQFYVCLFCIRWSVTIFSPLLTLSGGDYMSLPESVGNRIRELRKAKGWTQEQLAEAAGLHYSYIGGVERGDRNISLETLEKIILALKVPPFELFQFDENTDRKQIINELMLLINSRETTELEILTTITKNIVGLVELQQKKN